MKTNHHPGIVLLLALLCAGCQTCYQPPVTPFAAPSLPPRIEEIGPCAASRNKVAMFRQPHLNAAESEALAKVALRNMPGAEFFSDYQIHAVLRIYPSARLPMLYRLKCEISGTAARTNSAALPQMPAPTSPSAP